MKYAVIKTGGKQYRVAEGDTIEVDRLPEEKTGKVTFDQVLLLVADDKIRVGKPILTGEKVEAKLLEQTRGEKIRVAKFKSKVRYRKVIGFKSSLSRVMIEKFSGAKEPIVKKEVKAAKTASKKS